MARHEVAKREAPHETRRFGHGQLDLVKVGGVTVGRARFEQGWRWSKDVQPVPGSESCQASHLGYGVSRVLHVTMDGGSAFDVRHEDMAFTPPGHDGWVIDNEPVVQNDLTGMADYAKRLLKKKSDRQGEDERIACRPSPEMVQGGRAPAAEPFPPSCTSHECVAEPHPG